MPRSSVWFANGAASLDAVLVDFDQAIRALREMAGRRVVVVVDTGEWRRQDRPYQGELTQLDGPGEDGVAAFRVRERHDPRWTNTGGIKFVITRADMVSAERCGGPGELGVSIVQGKVRISIFPLADAA